MALGMLLKAGVKKLIKKKMATPKGKRKPLTDPSKDKKFDKGSGANAARKMERSRKDFAKPTTGKTLKTGVIKAKRSDVKSLPTGKATQLKGEIAAMQRALSGTKNQYSKLTKKTLQERLTAKKSQLNMMRK